MGEYSHSTPKQADLFERAAKCERADQAAADPQQQLAFRLLRELWTSLANECLSMSDVLLAQEIAAMEKMHAAALGSGPGGAAAE